MCNKNKWLTINENDLHFNKKNFELLLKNKIPAICIPKFLADEECKRICDEAKKGGFSNYEDVSPPIGKIGITQFEHTNKNMEVYFEKVKEAKKQRDTIFKKANTFPINKVIELLKNINSETDIAKDPKYGEYFAGLLRYINQAYLHFDFAKYDAPNWSINNVKYQLAFNIYISTSNHGGELVIYNQQWKPDIFEKHLLPGHKGSYGYENTVTKDAESFFVKPKVGDIWFFNTRNFHRILYGNGDRISISSFIGQTDKEIVLWS